MTKITKNMMIEEALKKYPKSAEVLMKNGIHCVGCLIAASETLEQGLKAHGKKDKEIDEIIKDMNKAIK